MQKQTKTRKQLMAEVAANLHVQNLLTYWQYAERKEERLLVSSALVDILCQHNNWLDIITPKYRTMLEESGLLRYENGLEAVQRQDTKTKKETTYFLNHEM